MNERPGTILVAGATGNMGGSALRHLLAEEWKVRALTRNPDSKVAQELSSLGAELVRGEYEDRSSLMRVLDGVYGVFMPSVQVNARVSAETEIRYGTAFIEAAKDAGIHHFVYASEMDANTNRDLDYLASKGKIESSIRELELPATILRHAFFVEWLEGFSGPIVARGLAKGLGLDRTIQVISLDDVGAFTAMVFNDPQRFIGQEIEVAGDEVSLQQIAQTYRRVKKKDLKPTWMPIWLITRMGQFGKFIKHLPGQKTRADIESLRILHPELKNLEDGLRTAKPMAYPTASRKSKRA